MWSDAQLKRFNAERIPFISEAFGWQGWEGRKMWTLCENISLFIVDEGNVRLETEDGQEVHRHADAGPWQIPIGDFSFKPCRCEEEKP